MGLNDHKLPYSHITLWLILFYPSFWLYVIRSLTKVHVLCHRHYRRFQYRECSVAAAILVNPFVVNKHTNEMVDFALGRIAQTIIRAAADRSCYLCIDQSLLLSSFSSRACYFRFRSSSCSCSLPTVVIGVSVTCVRESTKVRLGERQQTWLRVRLKLTHARRAREQIEESHVNGWEAGRQAGNQGRARAGEQRKRASPSRPTPR